MQPVLKGHGARPDAQQGRRAVVGAVLTAVLLIALSAGFQLRVRMEEHEHISRTVRAEAEAIARFVEATIEARTVGLVRMAHRWEQIGRPDHANWRINARMYLEQFPGLQRLAWIDARGSENWEVERGGDGGTTAWLPPQRLSKTSGYVVTALADGDSDATDLQITVPLRTGPDVGGAIVAQLRVDALCQTLLAKHLARDYGFSLFIEALKLAPSCKAGGSVARRWHESFHWRMGGKDWYVATWPLPATLADMRSPLFLSPIIGGIVVALLLGFAIYLAQTARLNARQLSVANSELEAQIARRRTAETGLRRLGSAVEKTTELVIITDANRAIEYVNPAFQTITGYSVQEAIGRTARFSNLAELDPAVERALQGAIATDQVYSNVFRNRRKDGSTYFIEVTVTPLRDHNGELEYLVATGKDVSERILADQEQRKLLRAIEQSVSAVVITDANGRIEYVNPEFTRNTGYSAAEAKGKTMAIVRSNLTLPSVYHDLWRTILAGRNWVGEIRNRRKSGELFWASVSISPLRDENGAITHFVGIQHDVTERKEMEDQLNFLAYHDAVTELPNRALVADLFTREAARATRQQEMLAVLLIDLDRFKVVNDTLGLEAGNDLLRKVGERLAAQLRDGDTVARIGGDEFIVLLSEVHDPEAVGGVAQKLLDALHQPLVINERELYVSGSIGVSLFPGDGADLPTLQQYADVAMYRAKDQGGDQYEFFRREMTARALERLSLETSLRGAVERGEFILHYQPQVRVADGHIVSAEALIRWQHPQHGLIAPTDFIPLLEETGQVVPVGYWVLEQACSDLARWQRDGRPDLAVAVNLSVRQFRHAALIDKVSEALRSSGIPPHTLELEITESTYMREDEASQERIEALASMGVRLLVDDFGTGYSSLSYLKRFPVHALKIDRSFIQGIPDDEDDVAITRAIIAMGQHLNMRLVAEGVETTAQRDFLQAMGCDLIQGFLYHRPVPANELADMMHGAPSDPAN